MDVDDYQAQASSTIQFDAESSESRNISLFGLAGEVGELATEYKKKLRDGDGYKIFREKIIEELGDIVWYVSTLASLEDIELSEVLERNLQKTEDRWNDSNATPQLPFEEEFADDGLPDHEKLPREYVVEFAETVSNDGKTYTNIKMNGEDFGSNLRDNAYEDDFYRYHDIFHLSYATVLGWSPVVRKVMEIKRKTDEITDEVEDGGRATVIDEAISILVFEYARDHDFFEGVNGVDYELIRTIDLITRHLKDLQSKSGKEWETAILLGFRMWRKLRENNGGRVVCNMYEKTMHFEAMG